MRREVSMLSRRTMLVGLSAAGLSAAGIAGPPAFAQGEAGMSRPSAHLFSFNAIGGGVLPLKSFAGRPVLVVNTASRCGFTHQYRGLQALYARYRSRGFVVIGVPSNDFGGQEPGSNAEIAEFCGSTFGVEFPLAAKESVTGAQAHPFYRWAARERPGDLPRWNFHKYLIDGEGRLAAVFPTSTDPLDPRITIAIDRLLAGGA
jgi:glutathione peroxidase